jgi:hypothetical protein
MVSTGAPESSNWPPGSSVTLHLSRVSAIGLPASSTGVQPNFTSPSSSARMLARAPS